MSHIGPSRGTIILLSMTELCTMQESAIEEYFKPIDKEAEALMKLQLEGEERTMKNMVKVMQQQALFEKAEAGTFTNTLQTDKNQHNQ